MKIIRLIPDNHKEVVEQTFNVVYSGGVVVTPSETIYGLSADPASEKGVTKTYQIKKMHQRKPIGLVAGNVDQIKENFYINEKEQKIMDHFWPGPVGLRLMVKPSERARKIAELTLGETYDPKQLENNKKVIRVTSNQFMAELSNRLGSPVISTSANLSGQPPCYDIQCVIGQLKDHKPQPDLVIDAGRLQPKPGSTMIDLTGNRPIFIREGADFKKVKKFLDNLYG